MVGLRNRSSWEPLLLKASCIKSCANGCSLGITANLTYANADLESVEGEWGGDSLLEHVITSATVFSDELYWAVVAQEVEWVIHKAQGWWFDPVTLQSLCQGILGQDTEPPNCPISS